MKLYRDATAIVFGSKKFQSHPCLAGSWRALENNKTAITQELRDYRVGDVRHQPPEILASYFLVVGLVRRERSNSALFKVEIQESFQRELGRLSVVRRAIDSVDILPVALEGSSINFEVRNDVLWELADRCASGRAWPKRQSVSLVG